VTQHPTDLLSEYLDGDLTPATRAEVDAHLAGCAACRATLAGLDEVRTAARAWAETPAAPATDLWPGIAARLAGPREVAPAPVGLAASETGPAGRPAPPVAWYRRRITVGLPELALAASLVAAVGTALVWQRGPTPDAPAAAAPAPIVAQADGDDVGREVVTPVSFADAQYDAAVADLERVLRAERERLDPRTVIVLERNLRVIDDAIAEARQALAADPANALLNAHLAGARQRKLDLLRRAALITEGD
jgi:hypothetical protein